MKYRFCLLFCVVYCSFMLAQPVDVEEAKQKALLFLSSQSTFVKGRNHAPEKLPELTLVHQEPLNHRQDSYYIFNNEEGGFIIVSGDDRAETILGFSDNGEFDVEHMSDGLKDLLASYKKQIALAVKSGNRNAQRHIQSNWKDISPLIMTAWNQDSPYNALCPIDPDDGERCITGCVPTAIAQVMYYHQWPEVGRGVVSYSWRGRRLGVDLSQMRFEWNKMKLAYDYDEDETSEEVQAVAKLMYSVGLASQADYSSSSTGAWLGAYGLHKYFLYSDEARELSLSQTSLDDFEASIYYDLNEKRPVLFSSNDPNDGGGHLMVIDGYLKEDNLFHINMGWGGNDDGYYRLTAVNADIYNFTEGQSIIYNIFPDRDAPTNAGIYSSASYSLSYDGTMLVSWKGSETEIDMNTDAMFWDVKRVKGNAFMNDSSIIAVNLPGNLSVIESSAFNNCPNLETVYIPKSVTYIGEEAFVSCPSLDNIIVDMDNPTYYCANGLLVNSQTNTLISSGGVADRLLIPEGIKHLGAQSLAGLQITSINLPPSLETIKSAALKGCNQLTSVILSAGIRSISSEAFSSCSALRHLVVLASTPPSLAQNAFLDVDVSQITLFVPEESIELYRTRWKQFTTIVGVPKTSPKKLVIYCTNGSISEIMLSEMPLIKNEDNNIVITTSNATITFRLENLKKMSFSNETGDEDAIHDIQQEGPREMINFSQLPPNSKIEIYDVSGKLLKQERIGSNSHSLNLSAMGTGIFLVRINGITYKIIRQ